MARILGKIFADEQILSKKRIFREVQRADLIGKYVGQTAPLTKEQIDKARGGVLFIDEAYTIASYIQDEAGRDYGSECVATLLKGMEDYRNEICVILAGYKKEMKYLLKSNPGFESRIQFEIEFPDYSNEELYQIFKQLCKKEKYKISHKVKKILLEQFERARKKTNFANARYVRNLYEKIKIEQANRVINNKRNDNNTILMIDIKNGIKGVVDNKDKIKQIGFITNN